MTLSITNFDKFPKALYVYDNYYHRDHRVPKIMKIWYSMVWYGMVWYGMVWYGMVWYGMVWWGGVVWGGVVWGGVGVK